MGYSSPMADTLKQLEELRARAVEQARAGLLPAQRACAELEQALLAARRAQVERERAVRRARESFAGAGTVLSLRAADADRARQTQQLLEATERTRRLERTLALARAELEERQATVRAAEVARRAVGRTLARQQADVRRRTELRAEEELEDSFRVAARLAAGRVSSIR